MTRPNRSKRSAILGSVVLTTVAAACSPANDPGPNDDLFSTLPTWSEYAPLQTPLPQPVPQGDPSKESAFADLLQINDQGQTTTAKSVQFSCTTQHYTMRDNPDKIVMLGAGRDVLYPGALIQGKSYKDGLGAFLGIPLAIDDRTPISVTITQIPGGNNVRKVPPTLADVSQAISEMVGNATQSDIPTPSDIAFEMREYDSDEQVALSLGINGHYLGFSASASGDFSRDVSEHQITLYYAEKMFDVSVEGPPTPSAWFTPTFTPEKLQEQITLGRMGTQNPPLYVSNVAYGRILLVTMTSSASVTDMRAALNAAYQGGIAGGGVSLSAKYKSILQNARFAVSSLGGTGSATDAILRSGDWHDYFKQNDPLSAARPLSYTLRSLRDNSIAAVSVATKYDVKECDPTGTLVGGFQFEDAQQIDAPVAAPYQMMTGHIADVPGKVLYAVHKGSSTPSENNVSVSLGIRGTDGTITFTPASILNSAPAEGWGPYTAYVVDVDGDQNDDVLIAGVGGSPTKPRIAWGHYVKSNGAISFAWHNLVAVDTANNGWAPYKAFPGHFSSNTTVDVAFNSAGNDTNATYIAAYNPTTGTFGNVGAAVNHGTGWTGYSATVGDINADNRADLVFNNAGPVAGTTTYYAWTSNGAVYTMRGPFTIGLPTATVGRMALGDVDHDTQRDILWDRPSGGQHVVKAARSNISTNNTIDSVSNPVATVSVDDSAEWLVGDVNGDQRADMVWNTKASQNKIKVALSTSSPGTLTYDTTLDPITHKVSQQSWSTYTTLLSDLDGDGSDDLVWVFPGSSTTIYVGRSVFSK